MKKALTIEWTAVVSEKSKASFEKAFRAMIEGYFGFNLELLGALTLQVFMLKVGVNAQQKMRLTQTRPVCIIPQYPGVCVHISANNGTQAFVCLLRSDVLSDEALEALINQGPFPKHPQRGVKSVAEDDEQAPGVVSPASIGDAENKLGSVECAVPEVSDVTSSHGQVAEPSSASDLSVRGRLLRMGVQEDDIGKLKITMASIVQAHMDEHGTQDPPHTFEVAVARITQAIREEMGLIPNGRGNFQGTIANFYRTRIALFGLKLGVKDEGRWLLDGRVILDFVGGADSLPGLKLQHVARLGAIEAATSVDEAARGALIAVEEGGDVDDVAIIKLAQSALAAREEAGRRRDVAHQNLDLLLKEKERLTQELAAVDGAIPEARELLAEAERAVAAYNFPPELHDRVRVAYARLGDILRKIGGNSRG